MRHHLCVALAAAAISLLASLTQAQTTVPAQDDLARHVDRQFKGKLFRGASVPFGMMLVRPYGGGRPKDIRVLDREGFTTCGFSGASMPTGNFDVFFLPSVGGPDQILLPKDPKDNWRRPDTEDNYETGDEPITLEPGYFRKTYSHHGGTTVELTATTRTASGKLTFPETAATGTFFFMPLSGKADVTVGKDRLTAFALNSAHTVYIDIRFDRPFKAKGRLNIKTKAISPDEIAINEVPEGIYLEFDTSTNHEVQFKIAKSYVSLDGAARAMEKENPAWDFAAVRTAAKAAWNDALGRIRIEGSDEQKRLFYTWFQHVIFHPNVISDIDGKYPTAATKWKKPDAQAVTTCVKGQANQYTSISGWDVYRSWVQLTALAFPDETSDLMQSMVNWGQQRGGQLPIWWVANFESGIMGGQSSVAILASGHAFGARRFDTAGALATMESSMSDADFKKFQTLGWIPGKGSPNIEAAVMHFSASRFAAAIGDDARASKHLQLALNWRNVFEPTTKLINPRDEAGSFMKEWHSEAFVEAYPNIYTLMQTFDMVGLIERFGGKEKFIERLDITVATRMRKETPYGIQIGNEPSFGIPWEYCWVGQPWKTQDYVRKTITELMTPRIPGDDDLGSISSWCVWAMKGMYPGIVGESGLVLHGPMLPRIDMQIPDGKRLVITAPEVSNERRYVQSVLLNGKPWKSTWLPLKSLDQPVNTLAFTMGDKPSDWGTRPEDAPPSFSEPADKK